MLEFLSLDLIDNVAILIIIIMCFFSLFLLDKNKKLKNELDDLKLGDRILASKNKKIEKDIVSIDKISKNIVSSSEREVLKNNDKLVNDSKVLSEEFCSFSGIKKVKDLNEGKDMDKVKESSVGIRPYSRNVLHDSIKVTSPINLDVEKVEFKADEFVKKEEKNRFNNNDKKNDRVNANDYLKEISNAIAEEMKPQTIELTDYEKDQEENAIISYKELLNANKVSNNVDSEEETLEFIEELKKLRNSLN